MTAKLAAGARWLLLLTAAAVALAWALTAAARLNYPYELEWMEGAMVDQAARVAGGLPLYVAPSPAFVPSIYTPLFYYLAAPLLWLLGVGYLPLRLLASASTLAVCVCMAILVRRESGSRAAGWLAAGLLLAAYRMCGTWYDIGRADMLGLALTLAGALVVRRARTAPQGVLGAGLLLLAFFAKQSALAVWLPLGLFLLLRRRWPAAGGFIGGSIVLLTGTTLLADYATGGWYSYYVFELPRQHTAGFIDARWWGFWRHDLGDHVGVALALGALWLLAALWHAREAALFHALLAGGLLGGAWFARLNAGGYHNTLIPACLALALLLALAWSQLPAWLVAGERRRQMLTIGISALCLLQFWQLRYDPRRQIPDAADRAAGDAFIAALAAVPGGVAVPYHGHYARLAGKQPSAHWMAVYDILRGSDAEKRQRLEADMRTAIADGRYAALALDGTPWYAAEVARYYVPAEMLFADEQVFQPRAGVRFRPGHLYRRRDAARE